MENMKADTSNFESKPKRELSTTKLLPLFYTGAKPGDSNAVVVRPAERKANRLNRNENELPATPPQRTNRQLPQGFHLPAPEIDSALFVSP